MGKYIYITILISAAYTSYFFIDFDFIICALHEIKIILSISINY